MILLLGTNSVLADVGESSEDSGNHREVLLLLSEGAEFLPTALGQRQQLSLPLAQVSSVTQGLAFF